MGKRLIIIGIIILTLSIVLKSVIVGFRSIKVDDFKPVAAIFLIDISASNQTEIAKQKKYITQFCTNMDPEDQVKILVVSQDAFLIYEGTPQNTSGIRKSMEQYTQMDSSAWGTAYGTAMKKAMQHVLTMRRNGYIPVVITIGDLENEGDIKGQLNWKTLPDNVKRIKKYCPELSMAFLYAHPSKLDFVKEKLGPIFGEDKLVISTEQMVDKVTPRIYAAMGR